MYLHNINLDKSALLLSRFKKHGIWKCKCCNNILPAIVHNRRKTYCSKSCEGLDYKTRLVGESNPNFKNAGLKICINCCNQFMNYNKASKYCKHSCYIEYSNKNRIKSEKPKKHTIKNVKIPKVKVKKERSVRLTKSCLFCDNLFNSSPSQNRVYCSYKCHLDNGGAKKAGDAAAMAKMKYGAKKDANHDEVFDVIKLITAVHDLSSAGFGVPDGCAWCGDKGWQFFDVKNPNTCYGRRGLNPIQKKWASDWRGGPVYLIYNTDEAQRFSRGDFDGLKRFPDDRLGQ